MPPTKLFPSWPVPALLVIAVFASIAGCADGRRPEFNFMLGYADVQQDGEGGFDPIIDDQGGVRTAIGIDGPVRTTDDYGSGLRLGGRLSVSGYRQDIGDRVVADEPLLEIEEFVDLGLLTPQFVASYRQIFGDPEDGGGAFVEPGLGLGLTIATLSFGSDLEFGDRPIGTDIDDRETEVGLSLNPFLRGGYATGPLLIGLEGGYQWTSLEFDDALGGDPREWYVGVFFGVQLGE